MGVRGGDTQILMARSTTACFGMNEVSCITFNVDTHVASVKTDDGLWLCGRVVDQHFRLLHGVSGGRSFLGADFVERDNHGGINGT